MLKINPEEISHSIQRPLSLFQQGIRSDVTRLDYTNKLKKVVCEFLEPVLVGNPEKVREAQTKPKPKGLVNGKQRQFCDADFEERVNEFVERSKKSQDWAENIVLVIVEKLRDRTQLPASNPEYLSVASINNYVRPIQKLFKMNKIVISWDRVNSLYPEQEIRDETREYTYDEIRKMLDHSRTMDKVLILLASSSGIRAGAFNFKWKHLFPVYHYQDRYCWEDQDVTESVVRDGNVVCALIRIYANSVSEYFAFTTPEFWKAVLSYKETWIEETGKEPRPEDSFFKRVGSPFANSLNDIGIRKRMQRIVKESGLRTPLPVGKRRHKVPLFNGFRRFFNKANKKSLAQGSMLASLILKENMMGHTGLIKLDKNYFKSHVHELIDDKILFTAIYDEGEFYHKMGEGLKPNLTSEETENSLVEAVYRWASRRKIGSKLGEPVYAMAKYGTVYRITIPAGKAGVILVSTELNVNVEEIVEKVIETRDKNYQ